MIGIALSSCNREPEPSNQPGAIGSGNGSAGNHAAGNTQAPANARKVADVADHKLVEAILNECHGPLRKRMQQVKVTVTLTDGRRLLVQADLPDRARIGEARNDYLLRDGQVHRLSKPNDDNPGDAIAELIKPLVRIVDAASFGPLYRATACRQDGDHFVLVDKAGTTTLLHLFEDTLLPRSFTYGTQVVRIDDYLRTKTTWIVNKASLIPLGTCGVFFEDGGILIPNGFFDAPTEGNNKDPNERVRMTAPGTVREQESPTPILVDGRAAKWALLEASDGWTSDAWAKRHEAYLPVYEELDGQKQQIFGFPMLWQEHGTNHFAIPFRQRKGGPALKAPPQWRISGSDATRMLVVYPAINPGDDPDKASVEDRIRKGTSLLNRALVNRKLKALGPIVAQPFIHLHRGTPDAAKLSDCKVRMSVRVQ